MIGRKLAEQKKKTNGIAPASLAFRMYAVRFEKDKHRKTCECCPVSQLIVR